MSAHEENVLKPWRVLESEEGFRTPWFCIQKYSCETPMGVVPYYVHEGPDSVLCACVTDDGFVVVERQYRFPMRRVSMDYPGGYIKSEDSNAQDAALRELREETGFVAHTATHLFTLSKDPAFSSGKVHVFLATDVSRRGTSRDPTETLVVEELRPNVILEAVARGEM